MKCIPHLALACLVWQGVAAQDGSRPTNGHVSAREAGFVFERGAARPSLVLPREETLVYRGYIDFGLVSAPVGTVTQTCRVSPFKRSLLMSDPNPAEEGLESATVSIHAKGDYSWYSLDSTIESRVLPQAWPRVTHRQISEGTEKRRREIMLGQRDGEHASSYRRDTGHGAPRGTRIWQEPVYRAVPEGTVDSLTAVFFARTLVREDLSEISFPLIEKDRLWMLTVRRGEERRMQTRAGTFDVVEVVLAPEPYPGEEIEEKKVDRFEGLFGIHGSIHLWVDRTTGVAVRILGDLPLGPITLGVDIVLDRFEGTPADFRPVE